MTAALGSFGLPTPAHRAQVDLDQALGLLERGQAPDGGLLAYGNGRSYGDSCLNDAGALIDMRGRNRILSFDPLTGVIEVESGVMLDSVITHAAPLGFFPAVVPGTRFVTVGGAIANDVHGKNHHRRGTFGCHVESLVLQRSDGRRLTCSANANASLFAATIGGMGLTGVILSARMRLMPVASLDIDERVVPFDSLDRYFDLAEAADLQNEYAVAWIDQLAGGRNFGRGLLITGNHAAYGTRQAKPAPARMRVPVQPPITLLNRPALTAFNMLYRYGRLRRPERVSQHRSFFFPLDAIGDWNRLYGPNGLYQHQSVIPEERARDAIPHLLEAARTAGHGSFLTVLKRFGSMPSPGILSFPRPGYTLTLDFPNRGGRTEALMALLDRITVEAGGAVNPYKDARMSAETFAASFPDWQALEALRDPAFLSDFWRRTALRLPVMREDRHGAAA